MLEDDVLPDGTKVKAGGMVTYVPYSMGRMEYNWGPDAASFKPERWLKDGFFQNASPFKFTAFQVRSITQTRLWIFCPTRRSNYYHHLDYLRAGWAEGMPRKGFGLSPDEDGLGHPLQVLRVQVGAKPPSEIPDDDDPVDGSWLKGHGRATLLIILPRVQRRA